MIGGSEIPTFLSENFCPALINRTDGNLDCIGYSVQELESEPLRDVSPFIREITCKGVTVG